MPKKILIATIMRPEGDTGVQTHFRTYMAYMHELGRQCELITPYNAPLWQVYPVFGLRKLVNSLNREMSVWWYRYWHAVFLCVALRRILTDGQPCVVYAQLDDNYNRSLINLMSHRRVSGVEESELESA